MSACSRQLRERKREPCERETVMAMDVESKQVRGQDWLRSIASA